LLKFQKLLVRSKFVIFQKSTKFLEGLKFLIRELINKEMAKTFKRRRFDEEVNCSFVDRLNALFFNFRSVKGKCCEGK
jgi:hypothetical protein